MAEGSERHNGYDKDGQNGKDSIAGRLKLLYRPSADFDALLSVSAAHSLITWDAYDGFCPPGTLDSFCGAGTKPNWLGQYPGPITDNRTENDGFATSLKLEGNLDWANIVSLTGFNRYTYLSRSEAPTINGAEAFNYAIRENDRFITQEVRLSSQPGDKISWVAGVYYSNENQGNGENDNYVANSFAPNDFFQAFPITIKSESEAVFGDVTAPVPFVSGLRLRAGVRYTHETKSANGLIEAGQISTGTVFPGTVATGSTESIWRPT